LAPFGREEGIADGDEREVEVVDGESICVTAKIEVPRKHAALVVK